MQSKRSIEWLQIWFVDSALFYNEVLELKDHIIDGSGSGVLTIIIIIIINLFNNLLARSIKGFSEWSNARTGFPDF